MIHAKLPKEDYEYVRRVFPGHGNLQAVTATLFKQLITKLKHANIKRYEFDNEETIRAILDGRASTSGPSGQASPRNVGGGTARVHPGTQERKGEHPRSRHPNRKRIEAQGAKGAQHT